MTTAVIIATRTGPRADGWAFTRSMARWTPRASTMPIVGATAMAQRVGTAELSTGTLCRNAQMPGTPVLIPFRKTRGPSDIAAKSTATKPSASTATVRRIQTIRPKNRITRPQPKNAFSSCGFCARRSAGDGVSGDRTGRIRRERTEVGTEVPNELGKAVIALRAEELNRERIGQKRHRHRARDEQPADEARTSPRCRRRRVTAMIPQKTPRPTAVMNRI